MGKGETRRQEIFQGKGETRRQEISQKAVPRAVADSVRQLKSKDVGLNSDQSIQLNVEP